MFEEENNNFGDIGAEQNNFENDNTNGFGAQMGLDD
jgi:hypothetical protein